MKDSLWSLRQYFIYKYNNKYGDSYDDCKKGLDLKLLKNLTAIYSYDVIYLAINYFFQKIPKQNASILLFSSRRFFDSEFERLIKNKDSAYYIRNINVFPEERRKKITTLLDEYTDYTSALVLSDEEITRKKEILKELEEIKILCSLEK